MASALVLAKGTCIEPQGFPRDEELIFAAVSPGDQSGVALTKPWWFYIPTPDKTALPTGNALVCFDVLGTGSDGIPYVNGPRMYRHGDGATTRVTVPVGSFNTPNIMYTVRLRVRLVKGEGRRDLEGGHIH